MTRRSQLKELAWDTRQATRHSNQRGLIDVQARTAQFLERVAWHRLRDKPVRRVEGHARAADTMDICFKKLRRHCASDREVSPGALDCPAPVLWRPDLATHDPYHVRMGHGRLSPVRTDRPGSREHSVWP